MKLDGGGCNSSVLAWRIPGTGGPGGLPSMGSHRVGHDEATEQQQQHKRREQIQGPRGGRNQCSLEMDQISGEKTRQTNMGLGGSGWMD